MRGCRVSSLLATTTFGSGCPLAIRPEIVHDEDRRRVPPPWTWWIDADEKRALRESPHIADLRTLRLPRGRGMLMGYVVPLLGSLPGLRGAFLSIMLARFRA